MSSTASLNSVDSPAIYPITPIGKGQITMMPRPRGETLRQDMAFYQQAGITHIICLLRREEIECLHLSEEASLAADFGIDYLHFAIKDMDIPDMSELQALNQNLSAKLDSGAHLAVHCNGGRGRAGTVAVSLLLENGWTLSEALAIACEKRGDKVPVCAAQEQFLADYAQQCRR